MKGLRREQVVRIMCPPSICVERLGRVHRASSLNSAHTINSDPKDYSIQQLDLQYTGCICTLLIHSKETGSYESIVCKWGYTNCFA